MHKNPELNTKKAYLMGVVAGDGNINKYISKKRTDYKVQIFGDKIDESDFFQILSELFQKEFGLIPKLIKLKDGLCLRLNFKFVLEFFEENGMKAGKKARTLHIPEKIKQNKEFLLAFIQGLADTDFCIMFKGKNKKIYTYPVIAAEFASEKIILDIVDVLKKLNISFCTSTRIRKSGYGDLVNSPSYRIDISGRKNLNKWMKNIGFKNPKHLTKLKIWEKTGFYPPYSRYPLRIEILKELKVPMA